MHSQVFFLVPDRIILANIKRKSARRCIKDAILFYSFQLINCYILYMYRVTFTFYYFQIEHAYFFMYTSCIKNKS